MTEKQKAIQLLKEYAEDIDISYQRLISIQRIKKFPELRHKAVKMIYEQTNVTKKDIANIFKISLSTVDYYLRRAPRSEDKKYKPEECGEGYQRWLEKVKEEIKGI